MVSQIFKQQISNTTLQNLLESISFKTTTYYTINNDVFKRGIYNDSIPNFFNEIKPCYYTSKIKYLERKLTYKTFLTVIRQVCNFNNIKYEGHIKYNKSIYDIIYHVYI